MTSLFETVTGSRAGLRDLSARGLVRATGADRARFLNGMLAADVGRLQPGQALPALQLDRKGHVLAELWVLAETEALLLDVAPGAEAELTAVLEKHIVADDVVLTSLSAELGQLGVEGPEARDALARLGVGLPAPGRLQRVPFGDESLLVVAGGSLGEEGARVIGRRSALPRLREALALAALSDASIEALRIEAAIPALGRDVTARNFPQEARLERAFSLAKGCYVGQEIVARIASRGAVNRLLVKLRTRALVAPESEIRVGDTVVGQVTSSAVSPASGPIALGYVKVAEARPGVGVEIGAVTGEIVDDYLRR